MRKPFLQNRFCRGSGTFLASYLCPVAIDVSPIEKTAMKIRNFGALQKAGLLAVLAAFAVYASGTMQGQNPRAEFSPPAPNEIGMPTPAIRLVAAGYTRPGAESKAIEKGALLGGTVLYAVFENTGTPGDTYGTGFNLDGKFRSDKPGVTLGGPRAGQYLYVYQVINDAGMKSLGGIRTADVAAKPDDIGSLTLPLNIHPSHIMATGYFEGAGLVMSDGKGDIVAASIAAPLAADIGHRLMAPAISFGRDQLRGIGVGSSTQNLIRAVGLGKSMHETNAQKLVEEGARTPDLTQIILKEGKDDLARSVFRAEFRKNPIKAGEHSVLVGFTTNLPPSVGIARLQNVKSTTEGKGIQLVQNVLDEHFGVGGKVVVPENDLVVTKAKSDEMKPINLVRSGFVSPGTPSTDALGKIIQARIVDKGQMPLAFGGTVYYGVYKRVSKSGDTWGVGMADFDNSFEPGANVNGQSSPPLDTNAEYIYLYQVVNDRGVHDRQFMQVQKNAIATAALNPEEKARIDGQLTREIASFSLKLMVDPRSLTSWGSFSNASFSINVGTEENAMAPADAAAKAVRMATSAHPSIEAQLLGETGKFYGNWVPSHEINAAETGFAVADSRIGMKNNPLTLVRFTGAVRQTSIMKAAEQGGKRPNLVQVLYFDSNEAVTLPRGFRVPGDELARSVFRVDWDSKNLLTEGAHSVVFGFTSNLPPTASPIRIKDLAATVRRSTEAEERSFIRAVSVADDEAYAAAARAMANAPAAGAGIGLAGGIGLASGVGTGASDGIGLAAGVEAAGMNVPAPGGNLASSTTAAGGGGGGGGGFVPPNYGGGGGGGGLIGGGMFGGYPGIPNTGIGQGRTSSGGSGGGIAGGTGGGEGGGQGGGAGEGSGSSDSGIKADNVFNITVSNQQSQEQFQKQNQSQNQNQQQNQSQRNNNRGGKGFGHKPPPPGGHVIPAPASLLLGLLGLPGLFVVYRRRKTGDAPQTPVTA
jgi:hypothetical protein